MVEPQFKSFRESRWRYSQFVVLAVDRGAAVVRVHDVRDTVVALAVWRAMKAQESQQQTQEQISTT